MIFRLDTNLKNEQEHIVKIKMTTWVYFIAEYDSVYSGWEEAINELGSLSFKVGGTQNIKSRMGELQVGNSRKLELVLQLPVWGDFRKTETIYQEYFNIQHIRGEWYNLTKYQIEQIRYQYPILKIIHEQSKIIAAQNSLLLRLSMDIESIKNHKISEVKEYTSENLIDDLSDDRIEIQEITCSSDENQEKSFCSAIQEFIQLIKTQKPEWYKEGSWIHIDTIRKAFDTTCGQKFMGQYPKIFGKLIENNLGKRKERKLMNGHKQIAILLKKYNELI